MYKTNIMSLERLKELQVERVKIIRRLEEISELEEKLLAEFNQQTYTVQSMLSKWGLSDGDVLKSEYHLPVIRIHSEHIVVDTMRIEDLHIDEDMIVFTSPNRKILLTKINDVFSVVCRTFRDEFLWNGTYTKV